MAYEDELTGQYVKGKSGRMYKLGTVIGGGGQAQIYALDSPSLVVKLYPQSDKNSDERRRLAKVYHLVGLLNSGTFVGPIDLLEPPHTGYVMERVQLPVSLKDLVAAPPGGDLIAWYMAGASLSQRYTAAIDLADAFFAMHQEGFHYQDLSFDNVLLEGERRKLRIIDCDNLTDGTLSTGAVGSPWFMAPEIVEQRALPNRETDAHSLAVLLYMLLTLRHPLIGDGVRDGDPEEEDRALAGQLPWVDHPHDESNATELGIPPGYVMPQPLLQLFRQTFEDGLTSPARRATPGAWRQALREVRDQLIACSNPECGHEFALEQVQDGAAACVWCDQKCAAPPLLLILRADRTYMPVILSPGGGEIRHYQVEGTCVGREQDTVMATYWIEHDAMVLRPKVAVNWSHTPPTARKHWLNFRGTTPLRHGSQIMFGDEARAHREALVALRHK